MNPLSALVVKLRNLFNSGRASASEVDAMVYGGDDYAPRVLHHRRRRADGWGNRRYTCDSKDCKTLP
jgi:hypothetical protein